MQQHCCSFVGAQPVTSLLRVSPTPNSKPSSPSKPQCRPTRTADDRISLAHAWHNLSSLRCCRAEVCREHRRALQALHAPFGTWDALHSPASTPGCCCCCSLPVLQPLAVLHTWCRTVTTAAIPTAAGAAGRLGAALGDRGLLCLPVVAALVGCLCA